MTNETSSKLNAEEEAMVKSTRRFDLRRILGAVFVLYGVIVTIIGLLNSASDMKQTGGIAINIWTGLSMLVLGILFFVWDHFAPVPQEDILKSLHGIEEEKSEGEGK